MIQQIASAAATSIDHRQFRDDEFWRDIPGWRDISRDDFGNHLWQSKNAVKRLSEVKAVLADRISDALIADIEAGLKIAPMNIRITPYVFSLIDWTIRLKIRCESNSFRSLPKCCRIIRTTWLIPCTKMSIRLYRC